jgi:F-type H+-transporting ATPase subunit a
VMLTRMQALLAVAAPEGGGFDISEMIRHHLADAHEWEYPGGVLHLPVWKVQIGGLVLDLSPTKHVVFMIGAALLTALLLIRAGAAARREHVAGAEKGPKGTTNVIEAFVLFLRDEVVVQNIGPGGERYAPLIVTFFFFILFCNLLGLLPWGASPTGNVSVTAALALITFVVVEISGMVKLGAKGYLKTIFYAPEGLPWYGTVPLLVVMTPIEFLSKLTKPFALAIRLYANMMAGHAVVLALAGLAVLAGIASSLWITPAPVVMAVAIMLLEIFVGFLQAYIFAMLSAVFIGLIRHAH